MIKIMINSLKIIVSIFFILLATTNTFSQTASKEVSITASGSGKTLEDAKQASLRSATEQAFGAFISSKTEMFNDQVVADQMASVSSGNIKSFSILNESQLPDGSWGVTLKALVSVDKLTSFVEAKGIAIEIKGGMFALNIKQQLLNEQGEIKAVNEMVGLLHEPMQISFDYVIKSSDPKSLDAESKNWEIPLVVTATTNKNIDFCANYCIKTLAALSLSPEEVTSYESLNKAVFPVNINYNGVAKTFYLRKQGSINAINTLTSNWEFYTRLFTVQSGLEESYGNGEGQIHDFNIELTKSLARSLARKRYKYPNNITINFLTTGQQAATFSWRDRRTLAQIEKMTGYTVKPRGVKSQFKHGGFVVYEKDGHGLVAAITDLGEMDWNSAKTACDELILNGYTDWHLPSKEELDALYVNLKQIGFGGFFSDYYWSSTKSYNNSAWIHYFRNYDIYEINSESNFSRNSNRHSSSSEYGGDEYNVRAVRAFSNNTIKVFDTKNNEAEFTPKKIEVIQSNNTGKKIDTASLNDFEMEKFGINKLIKYVGIYNIKNYPGARCILTFKDDKLYFSITTAEKNTEDIKIEMEKIDENNFSIPKMRCIINFNRDKSGKIISFTYIPKKGDIFDAEKNVF